MFIDVFFVFFLFLSLYKYQPLCLKIFSGGLPSATLVNVCEGASSHGLTYTSKTEIYINSNCLKGAYSIGAPFGVYLIHFKIQ